MKLIELSTEQRALLRTNRAVEYGPLYPPAEDTVDHLDFKTKPVVEIDVLKGTTDKARVTTGTHFHVRPVKTALYEFRRSRPLPN